MSNNAQSSSRRSSTPLWRWTTWSLLAIIGIGCWIITVLNSAEQKDAYRALLVNFLFFTPLAAALPTWAATLRLCEARFADEAARYNKVGTLFAVPSLLALMTLAAGSSIWSPWTKPTHVGLWLDPRFIFTRDGIALAIFWILAIWFRHRYEKASTLAGFLVVTYAAVFSLLGFDLVMSLALPWHSSMVGGYFFISGMYAGIALITVGASWTNLRPTKRLQDFGGLVVAFSILTTYMMYANLLPIWYENLPPETIYIMPRMFSTTWRYVSLALLLIVYFGPLIFLFSAWVRRQRALLGSAALLSLVGLWTERLWLVGPHFSDRPHLGFADFGATVFFLAVLFLALECVQPRIGSRHITEPGKAVM